MFSRNKSRKTLLTHSSSPDIQGERSSKYGRKKHYLTHEFDVLFNKINNIREWTKNLIKDSMAIASLEPDMNIKGYLEDSEKKHLGKTKLEILGVDMVNAAKGSGIKGGTYEKALIKVGECERRLGTYGRDFVVDVCSSFIRPLKYFLDFELNKLVEEKDMLTSRKIDFDYHVKQMNSGKIDKNVVHKLRMAEMALEFQYIHAKEVLQEIEASECQVGHLSDLISAQSVYHQKCLGELDKLKTDLKKISSGTETGKKSSEALGVTRKSTTTAFKREFEEEKFPEGRRPSITRVQTDVDENARKSLDASNNLGRPISQDQFQFRERLNNRAQQHVQKRSCRPPDRQASTTDKQRCQRNTNCSVNDRLNCRAKLGSQPNNKSPIEGNITDTSGKDQPNKECCNKKSAKTVASHSNYCKPCTQSTSHQRVEDQSLDSPATEEFSTDDSTSKETHVIPIPVRNDYRRDVGKMYFTPRP